MDAGTGAHPTTTLKYNTTRPLPAGHEKALGTSSRGWGATSLTPSRGRRKSEGASTSRGRQSSPSCSDRFCPPQSMNSRKPVVDKVRAGTIAAKRLGDETFNHATEVFRAVDLDGDGIPEPPRAATAAAQASEAIKGAAAGVSGAVGILFQRKRADNDRLTPSETKQKDAGPPGKQGAQ